MNNGRRTVARLRNAQGFYGWIGDVRIAGRALRAERFLAGHATVTS